MGIDPITFSLDLPDERFNENDSIKNVLLLNNLEENFIQINPKKIMETILLKVQTFDEPLPTPNCILHTILAKIVCKIQLGVGNGSSKV